MVVEPNNVSSSMTSCGNGRWKNFHISSKPLFFGDLLEIRAALYRVVTWKLLFGKGIFLMLEMSNLFWLQDGILLSSPGFPTKVWEKGQSNGKIKEGDTILVRGEMQGGSSIILGDNPAEQCFVLRDFIPNNFFFIQVINSKFLV